MTDLISREAAIALLTKRKDDCSPESVQRAVLLAAIEDIANMPSAEIGLPYVKFDTDLLATLRDCKSAVVTIQEKP